MKPKRTFRLFAGAVLLTLYAETQAMIETYGKQVSFVDDAALNTLKDTLLGRKQP